MTFLSNLYDDLNFFPSNKSKCLFCVCALPSTTEPHSQWGPLYCHNTNNNFNDNMVMIRKRGLMNSLPDVNYFLHRTKYYHPRFTDWNLSSREAN